MMKVVNIGFGNIVMTERIISMVSPDSAPVKRLVNEAREAKRLIDATCGRRTRSVLIMDNNMVVLSTVSAETIAVRIIDESGSTERLEKFRIKDRKKNKAAAFEEVDDNDADKVAKTDKT